MTASSTSPAPRQHRWHRKRSVRWAALLSAAAVGYYLLAPWLFMPRDLRAMQGTWKIVRIIENGKDVDRGAGMKVIFSGHGVEIVGANGERHESCRCDVFANGRELVAYDEVEFQLFGRSVHWPFWLRRPSNTSTLNYELSAKRLVLRSCRRDGVVEEGYVLERD